MSKTVKVVSMTIPPHLAHWSRVQAAKLGMSRSGFVTQLLECERARVEEKTADRGNGSQVRPATAKRDDE